MAWKYVLKIRGSFEETQEDMLKRGQIVIIFVVAHCVSESILRCYVKCK